jgi:carbon-monoxide dehydrogenase medium subunit
VVAGGTFVGILVNSRLMAPDAFLSLQRVAGLDYIRGAGSRIGALTTTAVSSRRSCARAGGAAHAFSVVASPRVRNQATVGGVLADADYASDPPSCSSPSAPGRRAEPAGEEVPSRS